jgi:hypothetical protein
LIASIIDLTSGWRESLGLSGRVDFLSILTETRAMETYYDYEKFLDVPVQFLNFAFKNDIEIPLTEDHLPIWKVIAYEKGYYDETSTNHLTL